MARFEHYRGCRVSQEGLQLRNRSATRLAHFAATGLAKAKTIAQLCAIAVCATTAIPLPTLLEVLVMSVEILHFQHKAARVPEHGTR
jgi:hypothetical protein